MMTITTTTSGGFNQTIAFEVAGCSGFSSNYRPEHILQDCPTDQASRWSSATNDAHQYILLKISVPALLDTITFGKFHKVHVCNLKEFVVRLGPTLESLVTVLHSGLRNDAEPETFPLHYPVWNGNGPNIRTNHIPARWVRIEPLAAWGNNFNYSIWHIQLRGIVGEECCAENLERYQFHRQLVTWKMVLKWLRTQPSTAMAYAEAKAAARLSLKTEKFKKDHEESPEKISEKNPEKNSLFDFSEKDPLSFCAPSDPLEALWRLLETGQYGQAEDWFQAMETAEDFYEDYLRDHQPQQTAWSPIPSLSADPNGDATTASSASMPGPRGGHQMVCDPTTHSLYLLGGWDGSRDLGDFWMYQPAPVDRWTCLSLDTRKEGGPGPRSCHKMVLHAGRREIWVMGRFIDQDSRYSNSSNSTDLRPELFAYGLEEHCWKRWDLVGVPEAPQHLIYDHQMAIDEAGDAIYIFGGRIINSGFEESTTTTANAVMPQYSGLYRYQIGLDKWTLLRSDDGLPEGEARLQSRIGHSMVFDPLRRQLIIYGGQRNRDYLCDLYVYNVDQDRIIQMTKDTSRPYTNDLGGSTGPDAGFTQRATLDPSLGEMYVYSGLMRERVTTSTSVVVAEQQQQQINTSSGTVELENHSNNNPQSSQRRSGGGSFWKYNIAHRLWTRLQQRPEIVEPSPRFAHQLIFDPVLKVHYLFGGNPGDPTMPRLRLNDFWRLELLRPLQAADISRRIRFALRRQQFIEMCNNKKTATGSSMEALRFLQNCVSLVVRHEDRMESQQFRQLSTFLFAAKSPSLGDKDSDLALLRSSRLALFEELTAYLPRSIRPPTDALEDCIMTCKY